MSAGHGAAAKQHRQTVAHGDTTAEHACRRPPRQGLATLQDMAGNSAATSVARSMRSESHPLPAHVRAPLERRFATTFADVRIHTGPSSELAAADRGAAAYTVGHDVVFGRGYFAPGTPLGSHLLAHELAHVVQQRRGGAPPASQTAAVEHGATAAAAAYSRGASPVAVSGASATGVALMSLAELRERAAGMVHRLPESLQQSVNQGFDVAERVVGRDAEVPRELAVVADAVLPPASSATAAAGTPAAPPSPPAAPASPFGAPAGPPPMVWLNKPPGSAALRAGAEQLAPSLLAGQRGLVTSPSPGATDLRLPDGLQAAGAAPTAAPAAADPAAAPNAKTSPRASPFVRGFGPVDPQAPVTPGEIAAQKDALVGSGWTRAEVAELGRILHDTSPAEAQQALGIDERQYRVFLTVVGNGPRPAEYFDVPADLQPAVRGALTIGTDAPIPRDRIDQLARDAASDEKAFRARYPQFASNAAFSQLHRYLRQSGREYATNRVEDLPVMGAGGMQYANEEAYQEARLAQRIEGIHAPSGIGAVAGLVTRAFTDDERWIGLMTQVGDTFEIGLAGVHHGAPTTELRPNVEQVENVERPSLVVKNEAWKPPAPRVAIEDQPAVRLTEPTAPEQATGPATASGELAHIPENTSGQILNSDQLPAAPTPAPAPTPAERDARSKLDARYGDRLQSSGGAIEETVRRLGNADNPQQRRSAAAEMRTAITYLENGSPEGKTVQRLTMVPQSTEAGDRSPDFVVEYTDGTVERIEVTAVTSSPVRRTALTPSVTMTAKGERRVEGGLVEKTRARIPTQADITQAIKNKGVDKPKRQIQLSTPLGDVSPGGAIEVDLPVYSAGRTPVDEAIKAALPVLSPDVHRVTVAYGARKAPDKPWLRDKVTYVRRNGTWELVP